MSPWNNKYQGRKKMEVTFKIRNKSINGCQQLEVSDSEYFKIMTLFLLDKRNRNVGFVKTEKSEKSWGFNKLWI